MSKRYAKSLRRTLEHICAYCGYGKDVRPPVWCVREHEVYAKRQAEKAETAYSELASGSEPAREDSK